MTDPKDDHQHSYTTTPSDDRVGSLDRTDTPNVLPDPADEVPGQTLKGTESPAVTRDPAAMEQALQGAEYAGSQEQDLADPGMPGDLDMVGMGNIGINAIPVRNPLADADQNPGYVPPSQDGPREVGSRPADMVRGAPGETDLQRETLASDTDPGGKDRP